MKKILTTILVLALLLPLISAAKYHEGETIRIEGADFNISTISGDRIHIKNEHRDFFIRAFDCVNQDIYLICVDNFTDDIVENWPHRYMIDLSWEKLCTDCVAWGQECREDRTCQGACAHGVCRPRSPWCGDGVCDEGLNERTCPQDCAEPEETTEEEQATQDEEETTEEETDVAQQEEQTTTPPPTQEIEPEEPATTPSEQPTRSTTSSGLIGEDANWLAGGLIIFGGLALLLVVFNKKKKKPEEDLYSYRK